LVDHDPVVYATACLFLAAKVEESPRKIKDIVTVFDYVVKLKTNQHDKNDQIPPVIYTGSFQFLDLKESVLEAEIVILKELGFSTYRLSKDNVHKWLIAELKVLEASN